MSNLTFSNQHTCWKQRVRKEVDLAMNYNAVVDKIKEQRPEKYKDKAIYPFKVLPRGVNPTTGEVKVTLPINSTNPSDPNSIKDLGPLIFVNPEEVDLAQIQEQFTETTQYDDTERNTEMDKELDDAEALQYVEELKDQDDEVKTNRTKHTNLTTASQKSQRMKEIEKMDRVKALIRRGEDIRSEAKSRGSHRSNRSASRSRQEGNALIKKMGEKLAEENLEEERSVHSVHSNKNKEVNPLLKAAVDQKMVAKSMSEKSLVSNTSLGKYVRSLKGELEKERGVKEKAIDILKKLKNNKDGKEIDKFLREFTN